MKNTILIRLSLICFFLWLNLNIQVTAQKNVTTKSQQGVVQDVTTQKNITNKNQQGLVQDNSSQKKTIKNNQKGVAQDTKNQNNSTKNLVSGIVTDKFGNPIAGAEIRVKSSQKMAATNINGIFELSVNEPLAVLQISHDGYANTEIIKGLKTEFEIVLQKDASNRDQLIVTKYDKEARYSLGSPVATITAEELVKIPYMNLAAALVGRLPGLLSRVTNSEPGSEDYSLNIRGAGTINGTSPLILIDGVPMSNLQGINPRDVASVSVFKDAASTILYGMQAASGIISVVTKDGDFGKARINVSANYSFMSPTRTPNMINSGDYATMRNQAALNDGKVLPFSTTDIANYYKNFQTGDSAKLYPNMNWYKTFVQPMVQSQRYNVSATGGINGLKYYTNIGYSNVGSPYKTDGGTPQSYDRFDFRSNVEVKLNKYMTTFMKVAGQVQRQNGSDSTAGSIYSSVFNLAPTMYGPLTPAGQVLSTQQETNPTYGRINKNGSSVQTSTNINTIIGLNIDLSFLTKGLSISTTGMFNGSAWSNVTGTQNYERWTGTVSKRILPLSDTLVFSKLGTQLYTPLTLDKTVTTNYGSYFDGSLKYEKQIGIHSINALLFARYQYQNRADLNVYGYLPYLRETSGGQLNYSLSNILFANMAASYEGTEQFAPGHQYGFFPAGSMAYVISNHDFLKNNKTITFLKVRASYGVNGNDQLSTNRLMYLDNITKTANSTFIANLSPIVSELQKGNLQYTWEKCAKTNLGIDVSLWNQLNLGLDVFREIRTDMVTGQNSVPALQGVATANLAAANLGKVQNQGFEIQLGYTKAFSKDFSINLQTYLDFAKNTILASDELPLGSDYAYQYRQKGYSIGQIFGYVIDKSNGSGYFNNQAEITNSGLTYPGIKPRPGDIIYKDLNGDHIINQKDMAPMGYSAIPQICYGANLNLKWKNFDLSILVQGVGNVSQMNSGFGYFDYLNQGSYFDNQRNAWTPERYAANLPISAPALSTDVSSSLSYTANSYYLSDRSYTRLKNVEIGYMLPSNLAKKISMESVRIYVSGNNLYTIDKMNNNDIDVENSGYLAIPINKTINIGLNVTF